MDPPPRAAPPPADPCTEGEVLLGPEVFARSTGRPVEGLRSFEAPGEGEICVRVTNGTGSLPSRVSSASVEIDGTSLLRPSAFNPHVEVIERRGRLAAGSHELSVQVGSRPGSELTVELRWVPGPALSPQDRVVQRVMQSLDERVAEVLAGLDEGPRADLLNGLAWFDESPLDVSLTRGSRDQVTHLSSRFLAYDVAPELAPGPTAARAERFIQDCDGGRALLSLRDTDELRFDRVIERAEGRRRFVYVQTWRDLPVFGAVVHFDLDGEGRLVRLDSTTVPGVDPPRARRVSRREAEELALESVRALDAALWRGVEPAAERTEEVVVHRLPFTGDDDERIAWVVHVVPADDRFFGRREVLVDRTDGGVIGSIERTRLLTADDQIRRAEGDIDGVGVTLGAELCNGTEACPGREDPPTTDGPFEGDLDEVQAALCEAERLFAERGAEAGRPDPRDWLDAEGDGIVVGNRSGSEAQHRGQ